MSDDDLLMSDGDAPQRGAPVPLDDDAQPGLLLADVPEHGIEDVAEQIRAPAHGAHQVLTCGTQHEAVSSRAPTPCVRGDRARERERENALI